MVVARLTEQSNMQQFSTRIEVQRLVATMVSGLSKGFSPRIALIVIAIASSLAASAQPTDSTATSVDPKILDWINQKIPKQYTIAGVTVTGIRHLDTSIVSSISGIEPGDKFNHPGADIFAKAINNLWRQRLFSGVQIYITKIQDDRVWIEINVQERPRLGNF